MIGRSADLVSLALRDPVALPGWQPAQWELLVRQARSANLISKLAQTLDDAGLLDSIPAAPRAHFQAALIVAGAHVDAVRREVSYIRAALADIDVDVVLLKGAAYLLAQLPAGRGRIFSDIDILVPKEALPVVEGELMRHGWMTTHHNAYDQRYYREWMHELPPMRHVKRLTVVDVHHAILPSTARLKPNAPKLMAASLPIVEMARMRVLAPADMVLHSATHLFYNEELSHGLRDLSDLDALLRDFGRTMGFWSALAARATEQDLARPLYYALRYASRILETPMPAEIVTALKHAAPPALVGPLMDALFDQALRPPHPSAATPLTALARWLLYVRAHWLRMPPLLLMRHLTIKALRKRDEGPD